MLTENINQLIRNRRAIFPKSYTNQPIDKAIIEQILENANYAPTHKRTEPWRFIVFTGDAKQVLSDYLGTYYTKHTPPEAYSEEKFKKSKENPLRAACVIAICMERHETLPEWEEIAAVACAVQNMWLTAEAYNIGAYWSTPPASLAANDFLQLTPSQKCLGFFYMGYHDMPIIAPIRTPIEQKTSWW